MYITLLILLFGGSLAGFYVVTQKRELSNEQKMKYLIAIGCFIGLVGSCNELFKGNNQSGIGLGAELEMDFYQSSKIQIRKKYELPDYSRSNLFISQDILGVDAGQSIDSIFQLSANYYQRFYLIHGDRNSGLTYSMKKFCQRIQEQSGVPVLFKSLSSPIRDDMSKRQVQEMLGINDFDILIETLKNLNLQYKIPLLVIDNIEYAFSSENGYFFLQDILQTISSLSKIHIFLLTSQIQVSAFKDQSIYMQQNIESKRFFSLRDHKRVFEYLNEIELTTELPEVEKCSQNIEFTFEDINNLKEKKISVQDYCSSVISDQSVIQHSLLKLVEIQCKDIENKLLDCLNTPINYNYFKSLIKIQDKELAELFYISNGQIRFNTQRKFVQALHLYLAK